MAITLGGGEDRPYVPGVKYVYWVVGGQINNGEPMGAFGDGQRIATMYLTGRHLTARMLLVRGNR